MTGAESPAKWRLALGPKMRMRDRLIAALLSIGAIVFVYVVHQDIKRHENEGMLVTGSILACNETQTTRRVSGETRTRTQRDYIISYTWNNTQNEATISTSLCELAIGSDYEISVFDTGSGLRIRAASELGTRAHFFILPIAALFLLLAMVGHGSFSYSGSISWFRSNR